MSACQAYLDEDFAHGDRLAAIRARSIDVLSAKEAGMLSRTDDEQIRFATSGSRLILTHNAHDFARIHGEMMTRGDHHAGICIVRKRDHLGPGEIARRLQILSDVFGEIGTRDQLLFLSNFS